MLWFFVKFSQLILKELCGAQSGELVCEYQGLQVSGIIIKEMIFKRQSWKKAKLSLEAM